MNSLDKLKANMAKITSSISESSKEETEKETEKEKIEVEQAPKAEEKEFQVYKSSLPNQRLALPSGKLISIVGHKYITDKEVEIKFLDAEIKAGFPYLSKEGTILSSELDPMVALRRRIIAEYLANEAAEDKSNVASPDLGATELQKLSPVATAALAALAAGSNS